jgi:hypothetical protein
MIDLRMFQAMAPRDEDSLRESFGVNAWKMALPTDKGPGAFQSFGPKFSGFLTPRYYNENSIFMPKH